MRRIAVLTLVLFASAAAAAQEEKASYDGRPVLVTRSADSEVQIVYDQPDMPLILRGTWLDPPTGVLDGMAYVHREGCASMEYRVKGVVDRTGALMVFGYEPQFATECAQSGSSFKVMRFTPPRIEAPKAKKEKPKPPPPRPRRPRPQYQPPAPAPSPYQYWQWRT